MFTSQTLNGVRWAAENRLSNAPWKNIIDVQMQLRHGADIRPAGAIDRNDRLERDQSSQS
jgi:hypothetical protein